MLCIKIVNDATGTKKIGNYNYIVMVNERKIAEGRIEEFERKNGWRCLVEKITEQEKENPSKPFDFYEELSKMLDVYNEDKK